MRLLDKPFVAVRWADAHSSGSVTEYAEHELPHHAAYYTVYGFLLRQDDQGITLANEHSDEHSYRGVTFIPAAMVGEVVHLRLGKARTRKAHDAAV